MSILLNHFIVSKSNEDPLKSDNKCKHSILISQIKGHTEKRGYFHLIVFLVGATYAAFETFYWLVAPIEVKIKKRREASGHIRR